MAFIVAGGHKGLIAWDSLSKKYKTVDTDYDISKLEIINEYIVGMSKSLHIYDAQTFLSVGKMEGHEKAVTSSFFRGSLLYTTSEDGMVLAWDLRYQKPVKNISLRRPICSGVFYRDEMYFSDYTGAIYTRDRIVSLDISNSPLYLEKYKDELIAYDRLGKVYSIETNSFTAVDEIVVGSGYGIKCASAGVLAAGSSAGVGFIGKKENRFEMLGFIDTPGWVWDMKFGRFGEDLFFVCSNGTLHRVLVSAVEDTDLEHPRSIESTIEFSVEYPLKAVTIKE